MLSERITEGYMYSFFPEEEMSLENKIRHLIKFLKEKHPDFKFNTCWINEFQREEIWDQKVGDIKIELDCNILKNHYWFVWIKENDDE